MGAKINPGMEMILIVNESVHHQQIMSSSFGVSDISSAQKGSFPDFD